MLNSEDEETGPLMTGPNIGRSYKRPLRIEPERMEVRKDLLEAKGEMPSDVLQDDEPGS